jgi:fatty acid amide hydrolase 2
MQAVSTMTATDELFRASALELAARVRRAELSPLELVEAHIGRLEAVNPCISALVADRFEEALAEARAAERSAADGGPLHGVPFTTKELIAVAGMPQTFGSTTRRGRTAAHDATVVARLRSAGAIPIGVSNMPEWGMWFETYNVVYGRTNNPWDLRRTPGGSSGGEGALVGAGAAAFGLGSDIGGSVRIPAAFCGTFGHKPSHGLLPLTGHYPVCVEGPEADRPKAAPNLAIGPLTRSAADLMPLLRIMAGPDGLDPNASAIPLRDPSAIGWRGRRVVLLPDPRIRQARRASRPVRDAIAAAGGVLQQLGAEVVEAPRDLLRRAADIWFAALQATGGPSFAEVLGGGDAVRLAPELATALLGRGRYSWPALFFCIGERYGRRGERALRRALDERTRLALELQRLMGDDGVLVAPVHPRPATRHNEPVLFPIDFAYTAVFNALRLPATAVPAGFDFRGLPLSVQVVAHHGRDDLCIAAALALEAAAPPWQPAPLPSCIQSDTLVDAAAHGRG